MLHVIRLDCSQMTRLRFEPGPFCTWVQHANHSATEPPPRDSNSMYFSGGVHTYADNIDDTLGKNSFDS